MKHYTNHMSSLGWKKAKDWKRMADKVAPTLSGGIKKSTVEPDLGPTRAKKAWLTIGVDGHEYCRNHRQHQTSKVIRALP